MVSKIYKIIEATESYFTEVELLNILCGLYWRIPGNMSEVKEYFTTKLDNKIQWIVDFFKGFEEDLSTSSQNEGSPNLALDRNKLDIYLKLGI
jgi:hypothetical protein